jgi:intein/homing endonuclease
VLLHIEVGSEIIKVTPEHPLWVFGRGWTEAGKLRPGDGLVTASGSVVAVGDIERHEGKFKVYNFEVEQAHDYFVSGLNVLAHNGPCGPGKLTESEAKALQDVANKHKTDIYVVGSRGRGEGRNIDTDLPVGKGPGTRSDIDVKIDGQIEINTRGGISDDLKNIGGGNLVNVGTRHTTPYLPYIRFSPKN